MLLERWLVVVSLGLLAACGGRAIVEPDAEPVASASADAGAPTAQNDCAAERATYSASATLIDHELDRPCATDEECTTESVRTRCIDTCLATGGDVITYARSLTDVSEQCLACAPPSGDDPCSSTSPRCDRGRCFALPYPHL